MALSGAADRLRALLHPPLSARTVWTVSFVIFAALGGLWSLASPISGVPDEPQHAIYAASIARGEFNSRSQTFSSSDPTMLNITQSYVTVPEGFHEMSFMMNCFAFIPEQSTACAPPVDPSKRIVQSTTAIGRYPPLYYASVGWPSRLFSPPTAVRAMRAVSALLCAALFASALLSAWRMGRRSIAVAGVAAAITPMSFFLAGGINPSGLEIAAAVALWAGMLEVRAIDGLWPNYRLVASWCLLVLTRPFSTMWACIIVAVIAFAVFDRATLARLRLRRLVLPGIVTAGAGAFVLARRSYDTYLGFPDPGLTWRAALRESVRRIPTRVTEMIGSFGWLDVDLPSWARGVWLFIVLALVVATLVFATWRVRVAVLALAAATVSVPVVAEVLKASHYGFIWQGRYSLPLAVGLPIVAGFTLAADGRHRRPLLWASLGGVGIVQIAAHVVAMRRNTVGTDRSIASYLRSPEWSPPFGVWALLVATIVTVAAYVWWLCVLATADATVSVAGSTERETRVGVGGGNRLFE